MSKSESAPDLGDVEFQQALAFHQKGQLAEAQALYEEVIKKQPNHVDALHFLGIIFYQSNQFQQAVDCIDQAIKINPNNAAFYSNRGAALQELKQFSAAIESYDLAIQLRPDHAKAYFNRGNALRDLNQFDDAVTSYDKAIQLSPDLFEAHYTRGAALQELKQFDAAVESYDRVIQLNPDHAEAYSNRGNALRDLNQIDAAAESYEKAIQLNPSLPEVHYNLGNVLHDLKQFEDAVASYDKAILLNPDLPEIHYARGNALYDLKQFEDAVACYDEVIRLKSDYAKTFYNRGNAYKNLKKFEAAVASYDQAIQLRPDDAEAYSNRGNALRDLKQFNAAVASYDQAIRLNPSYFEAHSNRGNGLRDLKQFEAAIESYGQAIQLNPDLAEPYFGLGNLLIDLKQIDAAAESYGRAFYLKPDLEYLFGTLFHTKMKLCDWSHFESDLEALTRKIECNAQVASPFTVLSLIGSLSVQRKVAEISINDKDPYNPSLGPISKLQRSAKIRIGYFSADFHNHATAYLMAELFESHDTSRFELFAFSFGPDRDDEMRHRVSKSFDQFLDVGMMSDTEVAELSRGLCIDIAVDLKGFTQDARLGIFTYRAAPIQVSYIGYPGTLAADYIDYLIADKTIIPEHNQQYYSEKVVYLPNSYQVNDRNRVISDRQFTREELGLPTEGFIFCCFNNNHKITPHVFDGWVRILDAVEGSILWLLEDNPTAAINLRNEAEKRGLNPCRLVFAKRIQLSEHLARHRAADLFLDTLPYNAHTTASDALWAGLPVLTCMGESFASRVSASLLRAIDLPELITSNQLEYESLAIELAMHPEKFKAITAKLSRNILTTPLFDTPLFTKHIEDAYTQMYEQYQDGSLPDHIYIK